MISVIIPLYNKAASIEQTLRSVLSQDYDDFEVIVVNDGSTDESAAVVRAINDNRIRLIDQENGGPSKARNVGVKHAQGEWILFLDADDELLPGSLSHFASLVKRHSSVDLFCCPYYVQNGETRTLQNEYKEGLIHNNFKSHYKGAFLARTGSTIYRQQLLWEHPFNENMRRFEDLESLFTLFRVAKVYLSNHPVLIFNQDYSAASRGRQDIKEDFLGYLDFNGKSFWERMCLYKLFIEERMNYPEQCRSLYPQLYRRIDYFILYKLFNIIYS